jgi:hypothetical protein
MTKQIFGTPKKGKSFIHKLKIVLFSLVVAGIVTFGIQQTSLNKTLMNTLALATTVKQETFTELYFENHLNLPTEITPNKVYSFKFTVHNLENEDMTYPYEIYLQAGEIKLPIKKSAITVKNNQYITVEEDFLINAPVTKSAIVVNLINKHQQIDFLIEKTTASTNKNVQSNQVKETVSNKIPSPTPRIFLPAHTRAALSSVTAASTSEATKQYGGWYLNQDANKVMVWLGKDSNRQDIWSDDLPK